MARVTVAASQWSKHPEVCGDVYWVEQRGPCLLFGLADGLGSGQEAWEAASQARKAFLENFSPDLGSLLRRIHELLRPTRGVVLAAGYVDLPQRRLACVGVGNVSLTLPPPLRWHLLSAPGIVGHRLPTLLPQSLALPEEERLILVLYSDGVALPIEDPRFWPSAWPSESALLQEQAERWRRQYGKDDDDQTLVLISFTWGKENGNSS